MRATAREQTCRAMSCATTEIFVAGNTSLQRLDLESKGLGTAGATALAQNIDSDTGLRHLVLTSNSLGDDGAAAVAPALHNIEQVGAGGPHKSSWHPILHDRLPHIGFYMIPVERSH